MVKLKVALYNLKIAVDIIEFTKWFYIRKYKILIESTSKIIYLKTTEESICIYNNKSDYIN